MSSLTFPLESSAVSDRSNLKEAHAWQLATIEKNNHDLVPMAVEG